MFSQISCTPNFGLMLCKKKSGLYASVYGINPAHHRQETKDSIFIVGALLSSQRAQVGIRLTVLKKQRNLSC